MDCHSESAISYPHVWVKFLSIVNDNERKLFTKIVLLLDKKFPMSILLSDDHENILIECYVHDLRYEKEDIKQYLYSLLLKLNNQNIHSYGVRLGIGEDQFIKIHQELSLIEQPDLELEKIILKIKAQSKELKKIIKIIN